MGTATTFTGLPLSPLTSFIIHQSHNFAVPSGGRKWSVPFHRSVFFPVQEHIHTLLWSLNTFMPWMIPVKPIMSSEEQRYHPGGVAYGLLPWVLTDNLLLTIFTKPPPCAELHHIIVYCLQITNLPDFWTRARKTDEGQAEFRSNQRTLWLRLWFFRGSLTCSHKSAFIWPERDPELPQRSAVHVLWISENYWLT